MSKSIEELFNDKEFLGFLITFILVLILTMCAIEYLRLFGILPPRYPGPQPIWTPAIYGEGGSGTGKPLSILIYYLLI